MKKIIAFDLEGTLINSKASDKAHEDWFRVTGYMMKKPSIKKLAEKKDFITNVLKVMERFTGLEEKKKLDRAVMLKYAKNLYQMLYLASIKREGKNAFVPEMLDLLVDAKPKFEIAVITDSPAEMVVPALEIMNVKEIFDLVYASRPEEETSKLELMKKFVKEAGKPLIYIGNKLKDAEMCKKLGMKFVLCKWGKYDKEAEAMADYKVNSPLEIEGILKLEA